MKQPDRFERTPNCDLCEGADAVTVRARCHLTAPLLVSIEGGELVLRCSSCLREVLRMPLSMTCGHS
jgi:hypothetical protein